MTNTAETVLDYSDPNLREELIADLHTLLHDYAREQFDDRLATELSKEDYYNQLTSVFHYLRDHLVIEFKN